MIGWTRINLLATCRSSIRIDGVFYRAHNPTSYGDSLDFRYLLLHVQDTQRVAQAFEQGVYGYVLRTTGPLFDQEGNLWPF